MLAGTIVSVTFGARNQLVIHMDGEAREFTSDQRVMVTVIPDDAEIARAYERGKADGIELERCALEEHLRWRL